MVNALALARAWLLEDGSPVPATLGSRPDAGESVYGPDLPEKIDLNDGPAITILVHGGKGGHKEIPGIVQINLQIKVWAGFQQYLEATQVYGAIYDWIHAKNQVVVLGHGVVLSCFEQTPGQSVTDPDTGWPTILGFFDFEMREVEVHELAVPINEEPTVQEYVDAQIAEVLAEAEAYTDDHGGGADWEEL